VTIVDNYTYATTGLYLKLMNIEVTGMRESKWKHLGKRGYIFMFYTCINLRSLYLLTDPSTFVLIYILRLTQSLFLSALLSLFYELP
jgi:hypothetical protein